MQLNINTDAAVVFTNKLEKLHKSGLPVAVRSTLNSAAFDVKQKTMPLQAKSDFKERNKNFLKATSKVLMAKGFNISKMKSEVGFVGGQKNQAVRDLEKQEKGGIIGGRSFIPMNTARAGNSNDKSVRKNNRLSNLKNIRNIDKINQRTGRNNLYKAVHKSGVGGKVIYKETLFDIKDISRGKIKLIPLFSYQKNRKVKVNSTSFMEKATLNSARKLENFYKIEAEKQIKRLK